MNKRLETLVLGVEDSWKSNMSQKYGLGHAKLASTLKCPIVKKTFSGFYALR